MAKRMILMLVVTVVVLTTLGFVKFKQVQTAIQASAGFQPPPEAVTTVVAHQDQWPSTMQVIGSMEAVHGVLVSADLPGTVARINFQSGQAVQEGAVLVELDTRQERAQLAALEAQRDLAKVNFTRMQKLVDEGVISRQEYDQAVALPGSRPKPTSARSAPPSSARRFARLSPGSSESGRSMSGSIWQREIRSSSCSR